MNEEHHRKVEVALGELTSVLHAQCIESGLITLEQWNKEIAPYLSGLHKAIDQVNITARTYRLHESII